MQSVIWDWNGTLLNDIELCISSINTLLANRNLKTLDSRLYKEVFSFPVKDYYAAVGFDFSREDFSIPAKEFIDLYDKGVARCTLHAEAGEILSQFKEAGKKQYVLSAMKQEMLNTTLKHQKIHHYFDAVYGLDDHYAVSKIERGKQMIHESGIQKKEAVIIGDTIHDFEVANELGIACILIANGHQSKERLQTTGAPVVANLQELMKLELFA